MATIVIKTSLGADSQVQVVVEGSRPAAEHPQVMNYSIILRRILNQVIEGIVTKGEVPAIKVEDVAKQLSEEYKAKKERIIVPGDDDFGVPPDVRG